MSWLAKSAGRVWVAPYVRPDGRRVKGHFRKVPRGAKDIFTEKPKQIRFDHDRFRKAVAEGKTVRLTGVHGSHGDQAVRTGFKGLGTGSGYFGHGVYFNLYDQSGLDAHDSIYSSREYRLKATIELKKPLVLDAGDTHAGGDKFWRRSQMCDVAWPGWREQNPDLYLQLDSQVGMLQRLRERLMEEGYDGIVYLTEADDYGEEHGTQVVVFDPEKSVTITERSIVFSWEDDFIDIAGYKPYSSHRRVVEAVEKGLKEEYGITLSPYELTLIEDYSKSQIVNRQAGGFPSANADFEEGNYTRNALRCGFNVVPTRMMILGYVKAVGWQKAKADFQEVVDSAREWAMVKKAKAVTIEANGAEITSLYDFIGYDPITDERQALRRKVMSVEITKADVVDISMHASSVQRKALQDEMDDAYMESVGAIGKAVRRTMDRLLQTPELVELMDAWYRGDMKNWDQKLREAGKALRIKPVRLAAALERTFIRGVHIPNKVALRPITWNPQAVTPQSVQWASARAGSLVVDISSAMEDTIRSYVTQTVQGDMDIADLKRTLSWSVKLDPRSAGAVERLRTTMLKEGRTRADANRASREYAQRLVEQRADRIARTETMTALNFGVRSYWASLANAGLIPIDRAKWRWDTDLDPCEVCASLEGSTIDFDGEFIDPASARALLHPPLHPNCRCTVTLLTPGVADLADAI